jgi:hypothetical protein
MVDAMTRFIDIPETALDGLFTSLVNEGLLQPTQDHENFDVVPAAQVEVLGRIENLAVGE